MVLLPARAAPATHSNEHPDTERHPYPEAFCNRHATAHRYPLYRNRNAYKVRYHPYWYESTSADDTTNSDRYSTTG